MDGKKFKVKYGTATWILLVAVLLLCLSGLYLNIYNAVKYFGVDGFKVFTYIFTSLAVLFLSVLSVSVMTQGNYLITEKYLVCRFGLIKNKTAISDIVEITHFKKSDKLVVYFKDAKYSVIMIRKESYDDFIKSLREVNREIIYDERIDGEETPE